MIEQLLRLNRQVKLIELRWVIITVAVTALAACWRQELFSPWVLIPFILTVAVSNNYLIAQSRAKKLKKINELRIDGIFWNRLQQKYPQIGLKQRRLIEEGFKDYLGLHVMNKRAYAMPSNAVDLLWHAMLEFPDRYEQLCRQALGRKLNHNPYTPGTVQGAADEKQRQLLEAWRYSCMLHGFDPSHTAALPRLFAIDTALSWPDGQIYDLQK